MDVYLLELLPSSTTLCIEVASMVLTSKRLNLRRCELLLHQLHKCHTLVI